MREIDCAMDVVDLEESWSTFFVLKGCCIEISYA